MVLGISVREVTFLSEEEVLEELEEFWEKNCWSWSEEEEEGEDLY
jgi:hypothetical protein